MTTEELEEFFASTPEHKGGPLWSLLDWSLWGAGMGDVFRESLADVMLAAVPDNVRAQAEAIMAEFIRVRGIEKTGVTVYQEQCAELERLRAEVERLTVLESGEQKAWANAGTERDRARQDAVYWRRQADRLRGAWESARRGRRRERAQRVEREVERDDALAEFGAERESNDALRKNRDQLAGEFRVAREALARVRSEADELRGGWQAADRDRRQLREQRDKANNSARDSRAELGKAREQIEFVRSFAERLARSGDPASAEAGRRLLDIVGPVTVAPGTPAAMQACPHRDFDDPTRCLLCHP
ncbi:hypothetical protein BJF79_13695 [Actinomadura sp. CNU-125]|nr:hypothetical protein BJF79_13695 [Actinomadura sp. CNU-125]